MKKPTVEEVQEYMLTREVDNKEQAEAFHDYHESGGWKVGKKPMVNWQAAIRTWLRHSKTWNKPNEKSNGHNQSFGDQQREQARKAMQAMDSGNGEIDAGNIRQIR